MTWLKRSQSNLKGSHQIVKWNIILFIAIRYYELVIGWPATSSTVDILNTPTDDQQIAWLWRWLEIILNTPTDDQQIAWLWRWLEIILNTPTDDQQIAWLWRWLEIILNTPTDDQQIAWLWRWLEIILNTPTDDQQIAWLCMGWLEITKLSKRQSVSQSVSQLVTRSVSQWVTHRKRTSCSGP